MDQLILSQKTSLRLAELETLCTEELSSLLQYLLSSIKQEEEQLAGQDEAPDESLDAYLSALSILLFEAARTRSEQETIM